jgi:serine protease Do
MSAAVVNVHADEVVSTRMRSGEDFNSLFKDFMEPRFRQEYATTSLGSGVLIDPFHVVTNHHVVRQAQRIRITTRDRVEYGVEVLAGDPGLDIAVLRVRTKRGLDYMEMGESSELLVGETVIAIGNPFGLGHTVTTGVVSALHRTIQAPGQIYHDFIQTDASINPGNSGGPLIDVNGRLIGINTAIYGRAQGIGFAIPVNRVRRIAKEIIENKRVRQGYLGIEIRKLGETETKELGLPRSEGALVASVDAETPAARSGLSEQDVILQVEGYPIFTQLDYGLKMRDYTPGDEVLLKVFSKNEIKEITIEATEVPPGFGQRVLEAQCGISLQTLDSDLAKDLGLKASEGIVITKIRANSLGDQAKLSRGDIIMRIDEKELDTLTDLDETVVGARRNGRLLFSISRNQRALQAGFQFQ